MQTHIVVGDLAMSSLCPKQYNGQIINSLQEENVEKVGVWQTSQVDNLKLAFWGFSEDIP